MHPVTYNVIATVALVMVYQFMLLNYISVALHRSVAHKAFSLPRWWILTVTALANLFIIYTNPRVWVAEHRLHHAHSDDERDPDKHPDQRFWPWFWYLLVHSPSAHAPQIVKVSQDKIFEHWVMRFFSSRTGKVVSEITGFVLPALVFQTVIGACSYWLGIRIGGLAVKSIQSYFAHSAQNGWGYRNYELPDRSSNINNPVASWLSAGECLQNNHHAKPRLPIHAHRPGEWDAGFYMVEVLERLGIAQLPEGKAARQYRPSRTATADAVATAAVGADPW